MAKRLIYKLYFDHHPSLSPFVENNNLSRRGDGKRGSTSKNWDSLANIIYIRLKQILFRLQNLKPAQKVTNRAQLLYKQSNKDNYVQNY